MPTKAGHYCATPGCGQRAASGHYCAKHGAERKRDMARVSDRVREGSARRGYDTAWRRVRGAFLKAHPLCACGCGQPAVMVDHKKPISEGGERLAWSNLQAMAQGCHLRKHRGSDEGEGHTL